MRRINRTRRFDRADRFFELLGCQSGLGTNEYLVDDSAYAVFGSLILRIQCERASVVVESALACGFEIFALIEGFFGERVFSLNRIWLFRYASRLSRSRRRRCCDRRFGLAREMFDAKPDTTDHDQKAGSQRAVGRDVVLAATIARAARALTM